MEAQSVQLARGSPGYPPALARHLADEAPSTLMLIGNAALLKPPALGLFCSVKCPGTPILRTYDIVRSLRDAGQTVIGGFQSPMEREALALLLRAPGRVVLCPARDIEDPRVPRAWRAPLAEGRLLLLSPFGAGQRRATAARATTRNLLVAALADRILIPYAEPGGKTEALARTALTWGKSLLTVRSDDNANLVALGATIVDGAGELARV